MSLPALHTVAQSPARHLLACERVARQGQWHENPVLALLQRCQLTTRWLLARYMLAQTAPPPGVGVARDSIARRLCAEICAQIETDALILQPQLDRAGRWSQATALMARQLVLQRMMERVFDVRPGTAIFDSRVMALGKRFERHLLQTLQAVAGVAYRADYAKLGAAMEAHREGVLRTMAQTYH